MLLAKDPVDDEIRQPIRLHDKYLELIVDKELKMLEAVQGAIKKSTLMLKLQLSLLRRM